MCALSGAFHGAQDECRGCCAKSSGGLRVEGCETSAISQRHRQVTKSYIGLGYIGSVSVHTGSGYSAAKETVIGCFVEGSNCTGTAGIVSNRVYLVSNRCDFNHGREYTMIESAPRIVLQLLLKVIALLQCWGLFCRQTEWFKNSTHM